MLTRFIAIISIFFTLGALVTHADYKKRSEWLSGQYDTISKKYNDATSEEKIIITVQLDMLERQTDLADSFESLESRVDALPSGDPREDGADSSVDNAEGVLNTFLNLDPTKENVPGDPTQGYVLIEGDPPTANSQFTKAEKAALGELANVNKALLSPQKPANVPEGDILDDFIPGLIRILMRFASLAVLISFITSGVFLVIAFGNEDLITKAKHMLYYTLIGFAFITLAFAIVKALTDIDFFGFI